MIEKSDHIALTLSAAGVGGIEESPTGSTLPSTRKSLRRVSLSFYYFTIYTDNNCCLLFFCLVMESTTSLSTESHHFRHLCHVHHITIPAAIRAIGYGQ